MSPSARSTRARFREIERGDPSAAGLKRAPDRGARLPAFLGLAEPAGSRLDGLRVMVVGSGSVGARVVLHLARLQAGEIRVVDPGRLKPESLLTHSMDPGGVGLSKVDYYGRLAKAVSPNTRVYVYAGPVQSLSPTAFERVEGVVMAGDNLACEVEVGQRCIHHRKPLLQAAVHGDTLVAQIRFWLNRDGSGPCPACAFGPAEWQHVNRETTFRCGGPNGGKRHLKTAPTMSVSFLCSMSADLAMTHLLRHALKLGAPLEDSLVEYCGYTHKMTSSRLERNGACRCEHVGWERALMPRALAESSPRQVAQAAGFAPHELRQGVSFTVDDLTFVDRVTCCGKPHEIRRFSRAGKRVAKCRVCGRRLRPQLFHCHRPTPAAVLSKLVDEPLERLGAAAARWVVVRGGDRAVFCEERQEPEEREEEV